MVVEPMDDIRALFTFQPEDFTPIERHPQRWRFEADILPQVRILGPAKAQAVQALLARYTSNHTYALSERYFTRVEEYDTSGDEVAVTEWLRSHDAEARQEVLVCHLTGVGPVVYVATWDLFSRHWDSFCHPASDDVVICPLSEAWILLFYHEEEFFWGKPISKVGDASTSWD